ncbi:MAG TPA: hypothetical protein VGI38_05075 [Puia sp.]
MRKVTLLFISAFLFQFIFPQPGRSKINEEAPGGGPLWTGHKSAVGL